MIDYSFIRILLVLVLVSITHCRNVFVEVSVPWSRYITSPIVEISEYLYQQQSKILFWQFVDSMCLKSTYIDGLVSKSDNVSIAEMESFAMKTASSILPSAGSILFLETLQGLNTFSPSVEFYNSLSTQYGSPCGVGRSFVILSTSKHSIICDIKDFPQSDQDFKQNKSASINNNDESHFDHLYSAPSASSQSDTNPSSDDDDDVITVALYGSIGTSSFCKFHHFISQSLLMKKEPSIKYTVRHSFAGLSPVLTEQELQGFGVFLDIKNMEYKTVDDSEDKGKEGKDNDDATDALAKVVSFDPDEDVRGIQFAKLLSRKPTLGRELNILRSELLERTAGDAQEMKVWKMKELGLQTLQAMAIAKNPVQRLIDIIQNFPLQAPAISALKVSQAIKTELDDFWNSPSSRTVIGSLLNSLFVNGNRIDLSSNSFNVYDVLMRIRDDVSHLEQVSSLVATAAARAIVLKATTAIGQPPAAPTAASGEEEAEDATAPAAKVTAASVLPPELSGIVRVDLTVGAKQTVVFANNLEKDAMYRQWPRTLQQLTFPSWQLQAVSRNIYTVLVVADPTTATGASLVMQANQIMEQQYPIRIGFVLVCDASSHKSTNSASYKRCQQASQLFAAARDHFSHSTAAAFLFTLAEYVLENGGAPSQSATATAADDLVELFTHTIAQKVKSMSSKLRKLIKVGYSSSELQTLALHILNHQSEDTAAFREYASLSLAYINGKGLPINSYSLNGIIRPPGEDLSSIMQLLGREQYIMSQFVRVNLLTDDMPSLFTAILQACQAHPRYHPMLEETAPAYHSFVGDMSVIGHLSFMTAADAATAATGDESSLVLNTTVVIAPAGVAAGLASIASALTWLNTLTAEGERQHRLAAALSLSADESRCLLSLSASVTGESSGGSVVTISRTDVMYNKECSAQTYATIWKAVLASSVLCATDMLDTALNREVAIEILKKLAQSETLDEAVSEGECRSNDKSSPESAADCPTSSDAAVRAHEWMQGSVRRSAEEGEDEWVVQVSVQCMRKMVDLSGRLSSIIRSEDAAAAGEPPTDEDAGAGTQQLVVVYNGRKLVMPMTAESGLAAALHALDLSLLASLEWGRIGSKLQPLVAIAEESMTSDKYLQISSFVGADSSRGARRVDVEALLNEVNIDLKAVGKEDSLQHTEHSMVYRLPPSVIKSSSAAAGGGVGAGEGGDRDMLSSLSVVFVLDPLTLAGQRATGIIKLFQSHLGLSQTIVLVPNPVLSEFPLQNFYRSLLAPRAVATAAAPSVSDDSAEEALSGSSSPIAAIFTSLPKQHTLTVRIDAPEPWNVQALNAVRDIDNLRCDSVQCGDLTPSGAPSDTTAVKYTLKSILIAGQCFERTASSSSSDPHSAQNPYGGGGMRPPNGLQLVLSPAQFVEEHPHTSHNSSSPSDNGIDSESTSDIAGGYSQHHSDTLVMQNLGYFQLQANPGLWRLGLAAGRASALFTVDGSAHSASDSGSKLIAVKTFADALNRLVVTKRPGKESVNLLAGSDGADDDLDEYAAAGSGGMWNSLTNMFGSTKSSTKGSAKSADEDNRIHVFSLATGHMYERLLRIMMLSVIKRTSMPVKFWLFENFLSPTFKLMAAVMAETYGFEVGYVTYKWPEWLTQQTQKQRIIWGYKILFLDVLFPLSVKKVIYVDADQVLRADLKELWNEDLHGKPYAYTPFCTSRKETLGFQFWRDGYWKQHLGGLPYHISALYVVDLQRFRRYAVGDQLRSIYDGLARDPNSLANLDQDLPNYAQHQVPIHSLPQEWLWCETWCSDESKSKAKTIDLCNSPLNKEPKLDMARRIVSGKLFNESWVELDSEIRELQIKHGFISSE